ncbi:hypothetical protein QOT17_003417 [Balamuthia mandrillaris]
MYSSSSDTEQPPTLPLEVFSHIFSFVEEKRDLLALSGVSYTFRKLAYGQLREANLSKLDTGRRLKIKSKWMKEKQHRLTDSDGIHRMDLLVFFLNFFREHCPRLQRLTLPQLTEDHHMAFLPSRRLSTLSLAYSHVGDQGAEELLWKRSKRTGSEKKRFKFLSSLNLRSTSITSVGLGYLAGYSTLKELNLRYLSISDEALAVLPGSLESLNLSNTAITDKGILQLSQSAPKLKKLSLALTPITGVALSHLAAFPDLQHLNISNTGLKGVDFMSHWPNLRQHEESEAEGDASPPPPFLLNHLNVRGLTRVPPPVWDLLRAQQHRLETLKEGR